MHKLISITLIIFISINCFSQLDEKDIIFDWENSNYLSYSINTSYQKFTPSIEEIESAKKLSISYIDSLNHTQETINNKDNVSDINFNNYYKQYLGYIDESGQRILYINACCSSYIEKHGLEKDWFFVFGGGSCFFNAQIDIDSKACIKFTINGDM